MMLSSRTIAMLGDHHPRGRLKTLESVINKLQRQPTIRLSQIQDIAGCRTRVTDVRHQNMLVSRIAADFPSLVLRVDDMRESANCGYRAVHVVLRLETRHVVEVQVRTPIQDSWANASELAAEKFGMDVKYCGGPPPVRRALDLLSASGRAVESIDVGQPADERRTGDAGTIRDIRGGYERAVRELSMLFVSKG